MSYSFKIRKDADGVPQLDIAPGTEGYLPDVLSISGHNVKPGESGTEGVVAIVGDCYPVPVDVDLPADFKPGWTSVLQASASVGRDRT